MFLSYPIPDIMISFMSHSGTVSFSISGSLDNGKNFILFSADWLSFSVYFPTEFCSFLICEFQSLFVSSMPFSVELVSLLSFLTFFFLGFVNQSGLIL